MRLQISGPETPVLSKIYIYSRIFILDDPLFVIYRDKDISTERIFNQLSIDVQYV